MNYCNIKYIDLCVGNDIYIDYYSIEVYPERLYYNMTNVRRRHPDLTSLELF
jgi:hypothetical protein